MKKVNDVDQKVMWKDTELLRYTQAIGVMQACYTDCVVENAGFSAVCWRRRGKGHGPNPLCLIKDP
jgi:hypothetical protein